MEYLENDFEAEAGESEQEEIQEVASESVATTEKEKEKK